MRKCLLFIPLLLIWSCSNKERIILEGKIMNAAPKTKIYLYEQQVTESKSIDSAILGKKGNFHFVMKAAEPRFYNLMLNRPNMITLLLSPGEKALVESEASNFENTYQVYGSPGSLLIKDLYIPHNALLHNLDSLVKKYNKVRSLPGNKPELERLDSEYIESVLIERKNIITFIIKNYRSMASIMALYLKYDSVNNVLQYPKDLQYYKIVSDTLSKLYPSSRHVKALRANFNKMMSAKKSNAFRSLIDQAKKGLPEIALPDFKGDTIRFSSTRGRVVLLSFWASDCRECPVLNRDYLYLYNKYRKSGFMVFQVALESDRKKWLTAIRGLPWINVLEERSSDFYYGKLYNIKRLPANFLIDRRGEVIGRNIVTSELDKTIASLIK